MIDYDSVLQLLQRRKKLATLKRRENQLSAPMLTHINLASYFWDIDKQCRPRSDAAEQVLHCLLTGISIRNRIKMKKYTRRP